MKTFLGIDTSNYTTSVALYSENGVLQKKKLLPVKDGERGIRQSDAVFHHTKAYPDLLKELFDAAAYPGIFAVGASIKPTTQEGSYMPCFLCGEGFARSYAALSDVPVYRTSHQVGHILAALYSARD